MTFQAKHIIEDTAAHGATLGFPGASTCVAVVANLQAELVGWHVTVNTMARLASNVAVERRKSAQGLQKFVDYVGGRNGDFFIVGHTQGHNLADIRDLINNQVPGLNTVYSFDITNHNKAFTGGTYDIFFWHAGGAFPNVQFKKTSKTVTTTPAGGDQTLPGMLDAEMRRGYMAIHDRDADFTAKNRHSIHTLRQYFVAV